MLLKKTEDLKLFGLKDPKVIFKFSASGIKYFFYLKRLQYRKQAEPIYF